MSKFRKMEKMENKAFDSQHVSSFELECPYCKEVILSFVDCPDQYNFTISLCDSELSGVQKAYAEMCIEQTKIEFPDKAIWNAIREHKCKEIEK